MKNIILISLFVFSLVSCKGKQQGQGSEEKTDNSGKSEVLQEVEDKEKEDTKFKVEPGDSLLYESKKYAVTSTLKDYYYIFKLHHKKTGKQFEYDKEKNEDMIMLDFQQVIKDKLLILDDGTSNIRTIFVIDMSNGEIVEKIEYVSGDNSPEYKDNKVFFIQRIEKLPASVKPPKCDYKAPKEQYGYTEKCVFDFKKMKLERLGEYKCQYFQ